MERRACYQVQNVLCLSPHSLTICDPYLVEDRTKKQISRKDERLKKP